MKIIEDHVFITVLVLMSTVALFLPQPFLHLKPQLSFLLGLIMFGIGNTLNKEEFKETLQMKKLVIISTLIKFITLPLLALTIGHYFNLNSSLTMGLFLIGCCPGGTASNVMSFLSKANVNLTVILTFCTTIISPLIIPFLIFIFFNQHINVPLTLLGSHLCKIILLPLVFGVLVRHLIPVFSKKLKIISPSLSMVCITLVVACVVALNRENILIIDKETIYAISILNILSYVTAYIVAKMMGLSRNNTLSLIFEYGMFDTAIAVVIATTFFNDQAALPASILSVIQNITATFIVNVVNSRKIKRKPISL